MIDIYFLYTSDMDPEAINIKKIKGKDDTNIEMK